MAVLWQRLADLFPNRWLNQVGTFVDDDGRESPAVGAWRSALAGLRSQQLSVGLQALIASGADYPPSAPRFRKLCFSDVPSEWDGYREACRAASADGRDLPAWPWSHPVVYAAAHEFGTWDLSHMETRFATARWAQCFARALERFAAGEDMHAPVPKRLAKPKREPARPEVVAAELAKLQALFNTQPEEPTDGPATDADAHAADGNPAPETPGGS